MNWSRLVLFFAGCCTLQTGAAQESAPASSDGAASSFGTPTSPSTPSSGSSSSTGAGSETRSGSSTSSNSLFGPSESTSSGTSTPESGATSSFGNSSVEGGAGAGSTTADGQALGTQKTPQAAPPTFSLPAFYGAAATTLIYGEGRLARPRFRYTGSVSLGYDDNVLTTPTDPVGVPARVGFRVVPGKEELQRGDPQYKVLQVAIPILNIPEIKVLKGYGPDKLVTGPPHLEEVKIPAVPPQERVGSAVTRGSAGFDMQFATSRALFTFDLVGNADHYWSRPGPKQTDYTGSLVLGFLYRITPRFQFTTQVNAAYLTQPDYSRINSPGARTDSAYLTANTKIDLSYRWSPRFTVVTSLSENLFSYQEKTLSAGDYNETIFGTELRYLWGSKLTLLAEGRYSSITYDENTQRNANSVVLLLGGEFRLSPRLSGSLRLGESVRTFDESGNSASSPYLEATGSYRVGPASQLSLTARFGFEEPGSPDQERQVFRTSISYLQAFSSRFTSISSLSYLHEKVTAPGTEVTSDTLDATFRLEYLVTKRFSLTSTYSFTSVTSSAGLLDYYRNRLFFGAQYSY